MFMTRVAAKMDSLSLI